MKKTLEDRKLEMLKKKHSPKRIDVFLRVLNDYWKSCFNVKFGNMIEQLEKANDINVYESEEYDIFQAMLMSIHGELKKSDNLVPSYVEGREIHSYTSKELKSVFEDYLSFLKHILSTKPKNRAGMSSKDLFDRFAEAIDSYGQGYSIFGEYNNNGTEVALLKNNVLMETIVDKRKNQNIYNVFKHLLINEYFSISLSQINLMLAEALGKDNHILATVEEDIFTFLPEAVVRKYKGMDLHAIKISADHISLLNVDFDTGCRCFKDIFIDLPVADGGEFEYRLRVNGLFWRYF